MNSSTALALGITVPVVCMMADAATSPVGEFTRPMRENWVSTEVQTAPTEGRSVVYSNSSGIEATSVMTRREIYPTSMTFFGQALRRKLLSSSEYIYAPVRAVAENATALALKKRFDLVAFDDDAADAAQLALGDATGFLTTNPSISEGRPMVSADGVITIQWQRGPNGLALIFTGDGLATMAEENQLKRYTHNNIEFSVSDPAPEAFLTSLATIQSA